MAYATDWETHGIVWRYWGQVDGNQLIQSNLDIYGDERFDSLKYQIVDLSQVTEFKVTRDDMITIAAYDKAASLSNPRVKIAVVTQLTAARSLTHVYETENNESPWITRLFDSLGQARQWVKVPVLATSEA